MLNLSTLDHVSNEELYRLTDQQSNSSLIRMHRLRWLGHAKPRTLPPTSCSLPMVYPPTIELGQAFTKRCGLMRRMQPREPGL
jgi:hypothetical protein